MLVKRLVQVLDLNFCRIHQSGSVRHADWHHGVVQNFPCAAADEDMDLVVMQLRRYLAAAPGGHRQLSAVGERFVEALPDRVAAKKIMEISRPRKKSRKRKRSSKPRNES